MKKSAIFIAVFILLITLSGSAVCLFTAPAGSDRVSVLHSIQPHARRAEIKNRLMDRRLEEIIPMLMRREGIDMWLVMNRENNEDPVYMSMIPEPMMYSPGLSILIYFDRGPEEGVEYLSGGWYGIRNFKRTWKSRENTQFENLARLIRSRDPKKIAVNVSDRWPIADGLSASLRDRLKKALGKGLSSRLVTAENLCVGWMETRSPEEISLYPHVCRIAHDLIAEFYSNRVITPGITTTREVVWWIRDRITDLGLETWFQPSISIRRDKRLAKKYSNSPDVIRHGDLLHCDVGIRYLGLCTDMQWSAYVCHPGENDAPAGLKNALQNAVKAGDILRGQFKAGRSGRQVTEAAMQQARDEGLNLLVYSHPLGYNGHGAGCTMDARDPSRTDEGNPLRWDYPLYNNTAYSIEFSCTTEVPEWGGQSVRIGYEEDALFVNGVCKYIDGNQTRFLLIK